MTRRKTRITSIGCQEPTCSTSPGPELQTWTNDYQTFKHQVRLFHGVQKDDNESLYPLLPKKQIRGIRRIIMNTLKKNSQIFKISILEVLINYTEIPRSSKFDF